MPDDARKEGIRYRYYHPRRWFRDKLRMPGSVLGPPAELDALVVGASRPSQSSARATIEID